MATKRPVLRVYGCGGMGVEFIRNHVMRMVESDIGKTEAFAEIKPSMIDTSKSNIAGLENEVEHYILRGSDGSGKHRATNHQSLKDRANEILQAVLPGDYNIVVHSGGGGSGSVLGPIIVSELISRELPTIVFCVGQHSSGIETENTYKTLLGYEHLASKIRKAPVPMVYFENDKGKTPEEIDNTLSVYLPILAGVFSGKNHGLDSMDIRNFLFYNRVSNYTPALTQLDLYHSDINLEQGESVLSLLCLNKPGVPTPTDIMVRYMATGVMHPMFAKANENYDSLRIVMVSNHFQGVIADLKAAMDRYAEVDAKTEHRSLITPDADVDADENGLIL